MSPEEAFEKMAEIYEQLNCSGKAEVKILMQGMFEGDCCGNICEIKDNEHDETIDAIRTYVKDILPVTGEVASEKIAFPKVGEFKDCNTHDTAHVDLFLYDDDEVDELVDEGKLSYNTCTKCQSSSNVKEVNFISHSLPPDAIKHLLFSLFNFYKVSFEH
eukprot:TRINITY_DN19838_c0_g1_i1.p1 TRINITY_DN19838_c0_g1~~TRINITY_DN19838_c0_g1_i1.p1  ORF type:complete len:160 (+),score=32.95 TRINITY_DN19838_c0_g1_i1:57-536(+)